jgi:hypothetical protein
MNETIPIYIGISHRFDMIKGMTERSILANTNAKVKITHLYPEKESGCTGFSNVRFQINYGIYLDSDMIVLGDIADLWAYRKPGKYVCMKDGSTEVAVIDCNHSCRSKKDLVKLPRALSIPHEWNVEDFELFPDQDIPEGTKLFHFTSLDKQPWLYDHPNPKAVALYKKWAKKKRKTLTLKDANSHRD